MLKIINAILILGTAMNVPYTGVALAGVLVVLSVVFYYMVLTLFNTLSEVESMFDDRTFLIDSSITGVINAIAVLTLLMKTDYMIVVGFILPWILIGILNTCFGWLIHLGILEIDDK